MSSPAKACPDCAETVKGEAKVCRFCGHDFIWRSSYPALHQVGAALTVDGLAFCIAGALEFNHGGWPGGAIMTIGLCLYLASHVR